MKALVIGGSGVVGAATAERLLENGHEVACLSRGGDAPVGRAIRGDVRKANLDLNERELARLRDGLSHLVACFGSVDWRMGPTGALETHLDGMRNVVAFAESCLELERLVHVSSVLVFGRTTRTVGNRDLDVGQGFHNWYEYGKFMAEQVLHRGCEAPWRIVRLGPVLGVSGPVAPSARHGLPAVLPYLLRGYPAPLDRGGAFPCYVGETRAAAEVIALACGEDGSGETWTWYDPALPTLAQVLTALCAPWSVPPRLMSSRAIGRAFRPIAPSLGLPRALRDYAESWVRLDQSILNDLPADPPECRPGYCEATGALFKQSASSLVG